jgi:hypothetical protein
MQLAQENRLKHVFLVQGSPSAGVHSVCTGVHTVCTSLFADEVTALLNWTVKFGKVVHAIMGVTVGTVVTAPTGHAGLNHLQPNSFLLIDLGIHTHCENHEENNSILYHF